MPREIDIEIDKLGVVKVDLKGFKGESCTNWTRGLAKALGQKVDSQKKAEYYETEEVDVEEQEEERL